VKAIVQDRYGGPEVLQFREIDPPVPTDDEVLVRVRAAGLDRGVWHVMTGLPYMIRLVVPTLGLLRPKVAVRGMDVAGQVEAVGRQVIRFQPGDEVFGWCDAAAGPAGAAGAHRDWQGHPVIDKTFPLSEEPQAIRYLVEKYADRRDWLASGAGNTYTVCSMCRSCFGCCVELRHLRQAAQCGDLLIGGPFRPLEGRLPGTVSGVASASRKE
jgi:hypothetical protein